MKFRKLQNRHFINFLIERLPESHIGWVFFVRLRFVTQFLSSHDQAANITAVHLSYSRIILYALRFLEIIPAYVLIPSYLVIAEISVAIYTIHFITCIVKCMFY